MGKIFRISCLVFVLVTICTCFALADAVDELLANEPVVDGNLESYGCPLYRFEADIIMKARDVIDEVWVNPNLPMDALSELWFSPICTPAPTGEETKVLFFLDPDPNSIGIQITINGFPLHFSRSMTYEEIRALITQYIRAAEPEMRDEWIDMILKTIILLLKML